MISTSTGAGTIGVRSDANAETALSCARGDDPKPEGRDKRMDEFVLTDAQYDAMLETLAKLIEATAKTAEGAAQIVRDAKTAK